MSLLRLGCTNYKGGLKKFSLYSLTKLEHPLTEEREIHSIVFETSPYGNVDAIVEHDFRAVYFYLNESPASRDRSGRFGMRACWVRNLEKGPHVINVDEMSAGIATMLPRHDCIDPELQRLPTDKTLKIVWLEEGTGAALIEISPGDQSENVIAVIPPWSGVDGFHGYASNCANPTDVCWPMPDNPLLIKRIENAKQFWESWQSAASSPESNLQTESAQTPWETQLPLIIENHDRRFGVRSAERIETEIPSQHFPLAKILQYRTPRHDVLVTAGLSIFPQPAVEMFVENPSELRRIEIAVLIARDEDPITSSDVTPEPLSSETINQLAGLALYPWQNFTWLGPGHSCRFITDEGEVGVLLNDVQGSGIAGLEPSRLADYRGDPVNLLWLKGISKSEYDKLSASEITLEEIVRRR